MSDSQLKNFNTFLVQLEGGALVEELGEAMRECVREIQDAATDNGGTHSSKLTLDLTFKINHKDRYVEIYPEFKTKLPKLPRGSRAIFFADADGNFTREDPRQLTIEDEMEKQRKKRLADAENAGNNHG